MNRRASFRTISLAISLLASMPAALAQVDESQSQTYQLRANIALANSISADIAKRYGIDQGPRNALVDVVIVRLAGNHETVPASVEVRASNLVGQTSPVQMQATPEAGRIAYIGRYKFEPDEVVDFDVVAKPEQSNEVLRAHLRKHFPPH